MFTEYLRDRYTKLIKIYTYLYVYKLYDTYIFSTISKIKYIEDYYFKRILYDLSSDCEEFNYLSKELQVYFNYEIASLPITLKKLYLGINFNKSINFASKLINLKYLSLSYCFNQIITSLPTSLKKLHLGGEFNHPIDFMDKLINLEVLYLSKRFNQEIASLPISLKKLHLGFKFNKSINFIIKLTNLEHLRLSYYFNQKITFLPKSLKRVKFFKSQKFLIECIIPNIKLIIK